MDRVVVFDLGGTLMEFTGMPLSWVGYYPDGFRHVDRKFGLGLDDAQIMQAVKIMTGYNPRVTYREYEIAPETIFRAAVEPWNVLLPVDAVISAFFEGIDLHARIYDYSFTLIDSFRRAGFETACLTDLPCGMPDLFFKGKIKPLLERISLYVSSQSCGYRKPNPFGLLFIAEHFRL